MIGNKFNYLKVDESVVNELKLKRKFFDK